MFKKILLAIGVALFVSSVLASTHVGGYVRKNGTYVAPHFRTNPNYTRNDNWSTRGNINPYTGKRGTKSPDYGYRAPRTYRGYSYKPYSRPSYKFKY